MGETEVEIKAFDNLNKEIAATQKELEAMGEKGKYPVEFGYEGFTEVEKKRLELEKKPKRVDQRRRRRMVSLD